MCASVYQLFTTGVEFQYSCLQKYDGILQILTVIRLQLKYIYIQLKYAMQLKYIYIQC